MSSKLNILIVGAMLLIGSLSWTTYAQSLTLEECQEKAKQHYPAIAQYDIVQQMKQYNIQNANRAYLPQLSLSGQASWQSEVTKVALSLPEGMPPIDVPTPDKDQYRVVAELNQLIWDGGQIAAQKKQIEAQAEVEQHQLNSEVYALRERVNQIYLGIVLMQEQLKQQAILEKELARNYTNVQTYKANGIANDADLSAIKVEQLKAKQNRTQIETSIDGYKQMLALLIGEPITPETQLVMPSAIELPQHLHINRPELQMFEAQSKLIKSQESALMAKNMPTIGAFAQGGYGKPGLNMFKNEFDPFFIGGIRFAWNFGNLYTYGNQKKQLKLQQQMVDSKRELFLYNLNIALPQQQSQLAKLKTIMQDDDEIIALRKLIREAAEVKVENGTMTVSDLIKEINAEEAAKQNKMLHQIEYLMELYNLKYTTN